MRVYPQIPRLSNFFPPSRKHEGCRHLARRPGCRVRGRVVQLRLLLVSVPVACVACRCTLPYPPQSARLTSGARCRGCLPALSHTPLSLRCGCSDHLKDLKVTLSPDPPVKGQDLTISASGTFGKLSAGRCVLSPSVFERVPAVLRRRTRCVLCCATPAAVLVRPVDACCPRVRVFCVCPLSWHVGSRC